MWSLFKEQQHTIKGRQLNKPFFFRIMPLFRLRHFILFQPPNSRALALACDALVRWYGNL